MHVLNSHDITFKIQWYGNYLIGIYLNWNEIKNYKDEIIVISENIIYGIDPIPV